MRDTVQLHLDEARAQRSHLPGEQSLVSAQSSRPVPTSSNGSFMRDSNAGTLAVAMPVSSDRTVPVPPDFTDVAATELWRSGLLVSKMILCFVLTCVQARAALLYRDAMPGVCIALGICTLPALWLTCMYFLLRALRFEPTWNWAQKMTTGAIVAVLFNLATAIKIGVFIALCFLTAERCTTNGPNGSNAVTLYPLALSASAAFVLPSLSRLSHLLAPAHVHAATSGP